MKLIFSFNAHIQVVPGKNGKPLQGCNSIVNKYKKIKKKKLSKSDIHNNGVGQQVWVTSEVLDTSLILQDSKSEVVLVSIELEVCKVLTKKIVLKKVTKHASTKHWLAKTGRTIKLPFCRRPLN